MWPKYDKNRFANLDTRGKSSVVNSQSTIVNLLRKSVEKKSSRIGQLMRSLLIACRTNFIFDFIYWFRGPCFPSQDDDCKSDSYQQIYQ